MKSFKKALAAALALAMVVTAVPVTPAEAASTAKLNTKSVTVVAGDKKQSKTIKVTTPSTWKSVKVSAKTGKTSVAKAKASGKSVKVTAVKKGTTNVYVTVTAKKRGKKVTKKLKAAVKVIGAGLKFTSAPAAEMTVGDTATLAVKKVPSVAKVTYSSDNAAVEVTADGTVTAKAAGEATITATSDYGKTVTTKVTVKEAVAPKAQLTAVKQTASNAFVATFNGSTPQYTKDDITVTAADGSEVLAVKTVEYAANGTEATVTLLKPFTNAKAYKIACKDSSVDLTATVGAVASIGIKTAQAQQKVATKIEFVLLDKDGIDVTPSYDLDTVCNVTVDGSYSSAELDKASKATITMDGIGDKAEITVTYSTNDKNVQDVEAKQTITCVAAEAVKATAVFAKWGDKYHLFGNNTNKDVVTGRCTKFYNGVADETIKVDEKTTATVDFCAKIDEFDAVSYDSYEVESANDTIASASINTVDAGKYAVISIEGNGVGTTQINVTTKKNGAESNYTIPVVVRKPLEAVKMTVDIDKKTMSNVNDSEYSANLKVKLFDKEGTEVSGNGTYEAEITTKDPGEFKVSNKNNPGSPVLITSKDEDNDGNLGNGADFKVTARTATAKTYTIRIKASDAANGTGRVFTQSVNVTVKKLPDDASDADKGISLTYQIETNKNALDTNPEAGKATLETRLYATYNGLFAGYVRTVTGGSVTVAEDNVYANTSTKLYSAKFAPKFGAEYFNSNNLYASTVSQAAIAYDNVGDTKITLSSLAPASEEIVWSPDGKMNSGVAREGTYTLSYKLYYAKDLKNHKDDLSNVVEADIDTAKYVYKTNQFKVENTIVKPVVKVLSRDVDSVTSMDDLLKVLQTNVDMNNNDSDAVDNKAFAGAPVYYDATNKTIKYDGTTTELYKSDYSIAQPDASGTKLVAKYAVVKDNYKNYTWYFYTPINTTFKVK